MLPPLVRANRPALVEANKPQQRRKLPAELPLPALYERFTHEHVASRRDVELAHAVLRLPPAERPTFADQQRLLIAPLPLFVQETGPARQYRQAPSRPHRHPKRRRKSDDSSLPDSETIRAVHEILYCKIDAETEARSAGARGRTGDVTVKSLEECALSYIHRPTKTSVKVRNGLAGLRGACERCTPHPAVLIAQKLLGWERQSAEDVQAHEWKPEAVSALWLLLEWLLPGREELYPPLEVSGARGAASRNRTKAGGGAQEGGAAKARGSTPLLPPRLLLRLSDVPKLIAGLVRRRLVMDPSNATPYLLRAAAMLVEPDDRSVVDVEELIVCWCDLWHNLDWSKLEWSLDAIPATNEPPPRRRVRKRAQRDAERQPLRIRLER